MKAVCQTGACQFASYSRYLLGNDDVLFLVSVPASLLRGSNKIVITAQNGTTITSVQLVTHRASD